MAAIQCEVQLTRERNAVRLCLPPEESACLGNARLLPAVVTINGHRVQATLHKLAGGYMMAVNAELRRRLGVDAGDLVEVSAEPDTAPRVVELPGDLTDALEAAGRSAAFKALTPFRQTQIVNSVAGARTPQTRARRIAQALAQLSSSGDS
ncbi:MAG TPA: YdeI/OmpD-associated family protein [Streptosporangiaceae bacterium]|nr:YdeI/OmpD-associated family protein [Streptosporangiaceae bacterium]